MLQLQEIQKLVKLTGDRAKLDAKANETYIVYKTENGQIVKEYYDGTIVSITDSEVPRA